MTPFEKELRAALARPGEQAAAGARRGTCPGEETWVLFVQGGLAPGERRSLREHLSLCSRCREILALDAWAETPGFQGAPPEGANPALRGKALGLLDPAASFDLVLQWVREGARVLHAGLRVRVLPDGRLAPALLRSGTRDGPAAGSVRAEKQLGGYRAEIEAVPADGERWEVRAFLTGSGPARRETGLRVSLKDLHRRRELRSVVAARGAAVFQGLVSGDYGLEFRQTGSLLGTVQLRLS